MQTKKFYLTVALIVFAMITGIGWLSYQLYNKGPRVRYARFDTDVSASAYTHNATVLLQFDRPIKQRDYQGDIEIKPAVDFSATTNAQSITITFDKSLNHATTYQLQLQPTVVDQTGKKMAAEYTHTFTTAPARYAYLQRNYGLDKENNLEDKNDHVLTGAINKDDKPIFSAPVIRFFTANRMYGIIAVKEETNDHLHAVDIVSGESIQNFSNLPGRVTDMALAPRSNVALITVQSGGNEPGAQLENNLFIYDFSTGKLKLLELTADMQISQVDVSNDGQIALVRDGLSNYHAVSPFDDFEPILLGTYDDSYGFDSSGSEIIFSKNAETTSYQIADAELVSRNLPGDGYVQKVSYQKGQLFSASITYEGGESNTTIYSSHNWQDKPHIAWKEKPLNSKTVYDFSGSYDGTMLAMQINGDRCLFDAIGINSECSTTETVLYDLVNQQKLKTLRGFDLIWLP